MRDISWSEIFDRIIIPSIANTLEMLFFCFIFSSILGFTVAVALYMTQPGGLRENKAIYSILNGGISILRSFPFMILMVSIIPITRVITGSSIGWVSALIPLTFASTPFMARMIENSIKEVNPALVDAAKSFGASTKADYLRRRLGRSFTVLDYRLDFIDYSRTESDNRCRSYRCRRLGGIGSAIRISVE